MPGSVAEKKSYRCIGSLHFKFKFNNIPAEVINLLHKNVFSHFFIFDFVDQFLEFIQLLI